MSHGNLIMVDTWGEHHREMLYRECDRIGAKIQKLKEDVQKHVPPVRDYGAAGNNQQVGGA